VSYNQNTISTKIYYKTVYIIVLLFYVNFILITNSPDEGHKSD